VACCLSPRNAAAQTNTLSEVEQKSGWKLLFDGQSLDGWRNYRQESPGANWKAVDGTITRVGDTEGGDLITSEQYENFELALEYNISPGGNSGLIYHATEDGDASWHTGPEVQIIDNNVVAEGQKSGWLYDLYPGNLDATRPPGQWNELRIIVNSRRCVTYLNGVVYARYRKGSREWDERVSRSKFTAHENFGVPRRGHICLQDHGARVSFRNVKIREYESPDTVFNPVDAALPIQPVLAFPDLEWADWEPVSEEGRVVPLRPVEITHAGDGSNRLFVCTQRGVIHVFENRDDVTESRVFLDISPQTKFLDREFERGLLGLAFHPNYKSNGQFFICYTTTEDSSFDSIVSRFRVDPNDPNRADPASEQIVMRIKQPFWNHNGGTIIFGPDGYLYYALGDGGAGGDPQQNGQNLGNVFGKILRIDIDRARGNARYAIPNDNPFANRANARSEIWAYGLRNVWRMSFDRQTGQLWAADVGQDLFEEINLIRRGGNYGWSLREGMHSFGPHGTGPDERLIEPIWEYDHNVGVSITGGMVYRGRKLPELEGCYVYADFISGKLWALRYDTQSQRVEGNHEIPGPSLPVTSFGEDQDGELYFSVVTGTGEGIYRFERTTGGEVESTGN
jgi:glucose/arabinose dehydrogenase